MVLPGYQKLRLFDDACAEFGLRDAAVGRAHPVHDKFVVAGDSSAPDVAVALTDVFIISGARGDAFSAERLEPTAAIRHLLGVIHTIDAARALGRQEQIFAGINRLVEATRLWRVTPAEGLDRAGESAERILALAAC